MNPFLTFFLTLFAIIGMLVILSILFDPRAATEEPSIPKTYVKDYLRVTVILSVIFGGVFLFQVLFSESPLIEFLLMGFFLLFFRLGFPKIISKVAKIPTSPRSAYLSAKQNAASYTSLSKPSHSISTEDWLIDFVKFFRKLDFFEGYQALSDEELADFLHQRYLSEIDDRIDISNNITELLLLQFDTNRVWWNDTEADVCEQNAVYKRTLIELAQISRGVFNPKNIFETWESETGPIIISYTQDQKLCSLHPTYLDDYIDLGILNEINEQLDNTKHKFATFQPFDQTAFVLAISQKEEQLLRKYRHWQFW